VKDGSHLSSPAVTGGIVRPTRGQRGHAYRPPIWPCSGWGFHGQTVSRLPVSSCLAISPLPASFNWRTAGGMFLWHFP